MLKSTDAAVVRAWLEAALRDGDPLGKTRAGLASACGVSSQAVTGWQKTGRITKTNLEKAVAYFGHGPRFASETNPPTMLPVRVTLMHLADHLAHFDELTRQAITPLVDRLISNPDEAASIAPRVERMLLAEPVAPYHVQPETSGEQTREAAERTQAIERARALRERPRTGAPTSPVATDATPAPRPSKRH